MPPPVGSVHSVGMSLVVDVVSGTVVVVVSGVVVVVSGAVVVVSGVLAGGVGEPPAGGWPPGGRVVGVVGVLGRSAGGSRGNGVPASVGAGGSGVGAGVAGTAVARGPSRPDTVAPVERPAPAAATVLSASRREKAERSQLTPSGSVPPSNHLSPRMKSSQRCMSSRTLGRNPTAMFTAAMSR